VLCATKAHTHAHTHTTSDSKHVRPTAA
jgi:hypothetical protein